MNDRCVICNKKYVKKRIWQRYCSKKCRWIYWGQEKRRRDPTYEKFLSIKKLYKLSKEEYLRIERKQKKKCAICGHKPLPPYRGLCVDHCHKSKKVRGLLCSYCNRKVIGAIEKLGLKKICNYLGYKVEKRKCKNK